MFRVQRVPVLYVHIGQYLRLVVLCPSKERKSQTNTTHFIFAVHPSFFSLCLPPTQTQTLTPSLLITTMTEQAAMAGSQASLLNFLDTQSTRSSDSIADYHDGSSQEQPVREVVSTMPWYHGVISRAEAETR